MLMDEDEETRKFLQVCAGLMIFTVVLMLGFAVVICLGVKI